MMASPGRTAGIMSPSNTSGGGGGGARGLVPLSLVQNQSPGRGAAVPTTPNTIASPFESVNEAESPLLGDDDSAKMRRKSILNIKPVAIQSSESGARKHHHHHHQQRQHQRTLSNDIFGMSGGVNNSNVTSPLQQNGHGSTTSIAMSPSSHHSRSISDMSGFSSETRQSIENEVKQTQTPHQQTHQLIDPDILVALAAKERHVLELRQELQQAETELDAFRNELSGSIVRLQKQALKSSAGLQNHSQPPKAGGQFVENKFEGKEAAADDDDASFPKLFDSAVGDSNKITTDEVVQIGKKFAEGINSHLWTIYKDIRQAARGEDQTEMNDLSPMSRRKIGATSPSGRRRRSPSPIQALRQSLSKQRGSTSRSPPPSPPIRSMASFLNLQNSNTNNENNNNLRSSGTRRKTVRMRTENTPDLAPPLVLDNDKED